MQTGGRYVFPFSLEATGVSGIYNEDSHIWESLRGNRKIPVASPVVIDNAAVAADTTAPQPSTSLHLTGAGQEEIEDAVDKAASAVTVDRLNPASKRALQQRIADAEETVLSGPLQVSSFQPGKRKKDEILDEEGAGKKAKTVSRNTTKTSLRFV